MIRSSTRVLFPDGCLEAQSKVVSTNILEDDLTMIFVEETPFHPLDPHWPDQPADKGQIIIDGKELVLIDCLTAVFNKENGEILVGQEAMNIRRDDSNWYFLVAHVVNSNLLDSDDNLIGKTVVLRVDADYRQALSEGHTVAHFAALALNKATTPFWRKEVAIDSLGNFDLDRFAIQESKVIEHESVDIYRFGKSLRKKGFNSTEFFLNIEAIEQNINKTLQEWMLMSLRISILPEMPLLSDPRIWLCVFDKEIEAKIPCGGTHILELPKDTAEIDVKLNGDSESGSLVMNSKFRCK